MLRSTLLLLLLLPPIAVAAVSQPLSYCAKPYIGKTDLHQPIKRANSELRVTFKCHVYTSTGNNKSTQCREASQYDIAWYKDGVQLQFNDDRISTRSNYLQRRGKKKLKVTRTSTELSGNYSCRIVNEDFYPGACNDSLSCFPPEAISFMRLEVVPAVQPSTAAFKENFPPGRLGRMEKGRVYLSRKVSEMQAPTEAAGREQKQRFQLRLVQRVRRQGAVQQPTVRWFSVVVGRRWPVADSPSLYRVVSRPYKCSDTDTLFNRGSFSRQRRRLSCYLSEMWTLQVNASTAGSYEAEVRLGNFSMTHPFRLDCRDCELLPMTIRFNKNTSVCLGDTVKLDCEVSPESKIFLISLGDRRLPQPLQLGNGTNYTILGLHDPRSRLSRIGNMTVRLQSVGASLYRAAVVLGNLSAAQQGHYACLAKPTDPRYAANHQIAYLTVHSHCLIGAASMAEVQQLPAGLYVILGMAVSVSVLVAVSAGICIFFAARRRGAPVVKRLRVVRLETNDLYHRRRLPTETPLLGDQVTTGCQPGGLVVPEIVVERLGGATRSNAEQSEANKEVRYVIPSCPVLEVDRKKVSFCKQIGQGAFGSVHSGQIHANGRTQDVAIKRLKHDYTEEELVALVKEMEIMRMMGKQPHPNIVRLIGVCTKNGPFLLLVELAHHGNLRDFLKERSPAGASPPPPYLNVKPLSGQVMAMPTVTNLQLLKFCEDVASALNFMASISIVHRDIAARNILVDNCEKGDGLVAKVADFGLTRNTQDKDYYRVIREGKLPVKWLAPECLTSRVFSTKSDVWAYGVLLYEIFSFGEVPYPGVSPSAIHQHLQEGRLNPQPQHASADVYKLMLDCWCLEPSMRPSFGSLLHRVRSLKLLAEQS